EHPARSGSFFLGETTLLLGIDLRCHHCWRHDGLAAVLGVEDRTAEIARQRRAEDRAGIVARQTRKTIGSSSVLRGIELLVARPALARLQRINQSAADADAGDEADTSQYLAGQPGDARRLSAQRHGRV